MIITIFLFVNHKLLITNSSQLYMLFNQMETKFNNNHQIKEITKVIKILKIKIIKDKQMNNN